MRSLDSATRTPTIGYREVAMTRRLSDKTLMYLNRDEIGFESQKRARQGMHGWITKPISTSIFFVWSSLSISSPFNCLSKAIIERQVALEWQGTNLNSGRDACPVKYSFQLGHSFAGFRTKRLPRRLPDLIDPSLPIKATNLVMDLYLSLS